jgi:SpoVK/Ycf46/Vps4 family AAA+-type ATPase
MGETAAKLRIVFETLTRTRGVYLFDEFDSIGSARDLGNDVGEMRRVVNSFLQMVEQDSSDSLIIAATNHIGILDHALFRRFDDVIQYELPDQVRIIETLQGKLGTFPRSKVQWRKLAALADGMSYADITRTAEEAVKDVVIHGRERVTQSDLETAIEDRRQALSRNTPQQP